MSELGAALRDHVSLCDLPSFSTGASFLDANSQAHHKPLSAFGDLTDNARDAAATELWIDVMLGLHADRVCITITDNGHGMSEHRLRTGIGGIAHSDKAHRAEVHYGMGAKSAMPRLSPSSLVFSKVGGMRTVALVSTTLSRTLGSHELKVPIATWPSSGDQLMSTTTAEAPLSHEARAKSLDVLLKHSPFLTKEELLAQFVSIPGDTGTRLVLYECDPAQFDVSTVDDVHIGSAVGGTAVADGDEFVAPHDNSLRSYLEVLYYSDSAWQPEMRIRLRGTLVPPRNWSAFLQHWPEDKESYAYTPQCLRGAGSSDADEKAYGSKVVFGTVEPLQEIISTLSARVGGDVVAAKKRYLQGYTGVFYYNHDRLILPLMLLPKQKEASKGNKMMTTEKRLTIYGTSVVGVCREGFLTPEHNKAGYEASSLMPRVYSPTLPLTLTLTLTLTQARSFEPSMYARPQRPSFQELHCKVRVSQ